MGLFTSGLGAHLTWTLPFGLLIMFAIFNRFDGRLEEAARDLGATPWQTFRHVVLPIILPSVVGIGLFGFTLSWDELARSSQAIGSVNTLPLELQGLTTTVTKPDIYALGTLTSAVSFLVIFSALIVILVLQARQRRHGSDAGKGMVGAGKLTRAPAQNRAIMRARQDLAATRRQSEHHRGHDREDRPRPHARSPQRAPRSSRSIRRMDRSRSRAITTRRSRCRDCWPKSPRARLSGVSGAPHHRLL